MVAYATAYIFETNPANAAKLRLLVYVFESGWSGLVSH